MRRMLSAVDYCISSLGVRLSRAGRERFILSVTICLLIAVTAGAGRAATFESTGLYHSYNELAGWAYDLQAQNPDLMNVVQYGTSVQGRALLAINITTDPLVNNPAKPEFLFTAGIHAREVITSESARTLTETLIDGYRSGAYQDMLSTRDVWIIPDQNPDGRMAVEGGLSVQRKNMHLYPTQDESTATRGVDLNRNYPHRWILASNVVRNETYRGPSELSEPESSSLWALLHDENRFSNLTAAIDFHSGAAMIISPWLSQNDNAIYPLPADDRAKLDSLARHMSLVSGYPHTRLNYSSYGTLTDSLYEEFGTYAFTEELFKGVFSDYFTYFNPTTESVRDATIAKAVNSALYLLNDDAFTVPEPCMLGLLAIGGLLLPIRNRRRRANG